MTDTLYNLLRPYHHQIEFNFGEFEKFIRALGWDDPIKWYEYWMKKEASDFIYEFWPKGTRADWFWGLGLPFLTKVENLMKKNDHPLLLGLSGLPGCGKTSFGRWLEDVAFIYNLPLCVVSLDDFYLPSPLLDTAMSGNPWGVPRGLPGSHDLKLLEESIYKFLERGVLSSPRFDKSLRNGFGDRCGWRLSRPRILVVEGWFLGCSAHHKPDSLPAQTLQKNEIEYRNQVIDCLKSYESIWKYFLSIWHLKAQKLEFTSTWKRQQETHLKETKGNSLKGETLENFIRMIQVSLPQNSLMSINAEVVAHLDVNRQITWVGMKSIEDQCLDHQ